MTSINDKIRVLGGDPGVRSGGAAYLRVGQPEEVIAAFSLVETEKQRKAAKDKVANLIQKNGGWGDSTYMVLSLRARRWNVSFCEFLDTISKEFGKPHLIALESFVDQAQHAKKMMANRFQTPHLIGLLEGELSKRGYSVEEGNLIYQNAGVVIPQLSSEIAALEDRDRYKMKNFAVIPGDEVIKNDHMRKALAHALAAAFRIQRGELIVPPITPTITLDTEESK